MYENAKPELQRILRLVEDCPESLREKAFEVLLTGYVESLLSKGASPRSTMPTEAASARPPSGSTGTEWSASVPQDILQRLQAMAQRRKVGAEKLAAVFDFSSDPFAFAPVHVEGTSKKERTRNVAMLVAARSFLATSRWVADWAEVKAMCTHQNCYDLPNFAATLKQAKGDVFKSVNAGTSIELSARGTEQAEQLLAILAGASDASEK